MKESKIKRSFVSPENTKLLLETSPDKYSLDLFYEWFTDSGDNKHLFYPEDTVVIPPEYNRTPTNTPEDNSWNIRYASNWSSISATTVGRIVFNNLIFSRSKELRTNNKFYNYYFNGPEIDKLQQIVADQYIDKLISKDDIDFFIDRLVWISYSCSSMFNPSMTYKTITIPPKTKKLKQKLLKDMAEELKKLDPSSISKLETELINSAVEELDGVDPGFEIFSSKSRGSVGNNFKNTALIRGLVGKVDNPNDFRLSTNSLEEGIPLEEQHIYGDTIVSASYNRAVGTRDGGYKAKQLNAAFQSLQLVEDEKYDCGSTFTIKVKMDNPKDFMYRYVLKQNGSLVQITPENADQVKGKEVKLRTPLYCKAKKGICSKCAGTFYYRLGIRNIGLITSRLGTSLMNQALKAFHNSTVSINKIDFDDFISKI